jgi:hypothetical protein
MNIDIIQIIGEHCNASSWFSLCCANNAYRKSQSKNLSDTETDFFVKTMTSIIRGTPNEKGRLTRIKYYHRMLRFVLKFGHVKISPDFYEILDRKLDDMRTLGMSDRMLRRYKKHIRTVINKSFKQQE